MALIAWFQLNGNLRNNGLINGISASSTVACQTTGSPLNCWCYKFTTGQSITFTGINFSKLSKVSVSLWVYQDSKVNTVFFNGQSTSYYLGASQNTGTSDFYHGQVSGTKISYVDGVPGTKLGSAGTWHHYVFTDVNLSSWTSFKFNNYSSAFNFAGRVFDIRIYDHVLCEDDVKRIYHRKMYELVPYSDSKNVLFDRSGYCLMPMVNNGAVFNVNSLYFDGGASTRLRPQNGNVGFGLTEGTLSIWFKPISKPSDYRILVIDSTSKMAIGFYNSGNHFLLTSNGTASKAFSSASIKYGELNNIIVGYTSNVPQYCIINGVAVAQNGGSSNWSETGGFTIGGRTYNNLNFNGTIYKVELHKKSLTSDEAIELYNSEKGMFLPDDYIQLEYIQSDGNQWINTGNKFNPESDSFKVTFKGNDTTNNGMIIGTLSTNYIWLYYYKDGGGINLYASNNTNQERIPGISPQDLIIHTAEFKNKHFYFDGIDKGGLTKTHSESTHNVYLFSRGTSNPFKGRIYYADFKKNGVYTNIFYQQNVNLTM